MPTSKRLRDIIREIRAARTSAEERAVVNKECADIRDAFREEDPTYRCRNVAKLLYIHMLGYPAHFGQLECLKLIASPKFSDKRIGYLGAMLLLDERTDVHLLITNSLKNDLNHTTPYIASLALCTLGSICSSEMSRDLAGEVDRLIRFSNAYLRKKSANSLNELTQHQFSYDIQLEKATLCAYRIIRKVPDLMEMFIPCTRGLLAEKNNGVLLAAVCLITTMCQKSPDSLNYFKKLTPTLVQILKNLIMGGHSPDNDVGGVTDPFLQVKLLRLLQILGRGDPETSEAMNDILAQVATNTETSRNVGHAILYEIVLTIMGIESESGLRVLAVNILGRFLLNNDKNIRYVALNTLHRVIHVDSKAVQRHRSTVVDCLKDPDVSIKRRAMELCFLLMSPQNVVAVMTEMLLFLAGCEVDFKADCCSGIAGAADRLAPNRRWHIDTLLTVLVTAGNDARDDVIFNLVALISESPGLHAYAAAQLFLAFQRDLTQQPLVQVAAWCIGEYGDLLVDGTSTVRIPGMEPLHLSEEEVLEVLAAALLSSLTAQCGKQMVVMAAMKLSTRFRQPASILRIRHLVSVYSTSSHIEIQQRSVEFSAIYRSHDTLLAGLLERMPVLQSRSVTAADTFDSTAAEGAAAGAGGALAASVNGHGEGGSGRAEENLLDLLSLSPLPNGGGPTESHSTSGSNNYILDLIGDLTPTSYANSAPTTTTSPGSNPATLPTMTAFEKNGLHITFQLEHTAGSPHTTVLASLTNSSVHPLTEVVLQAALPKTQQLVLMPPSGSLLPALGGGSVSQVMKITNPDREELVNTMYIFSFEK